MRKYLLLPPALSLLAALLPAQTPKVSVVFTGRFDSFSLDPNGGSLNQIREFDLGIATPGPGAAARDWLPTTAWEAMMGDSHKDGNYTRFYKWKTYFERFNFHGLFVKYKDMAKGDPKLVYFTIRDNKVNKVFKVFDKGGTVQVQVKPGDFIRFLPGGNIEYFITQSLIMKAAGKQKNSFSPGASALCQDAKGNLYYSPAEGGHWVGGNWLNDGGIAMIKASDITYDANGNVKDVKAGSAFRILGETANGPNGQINIRQMVANANAKDYKGNTIGITYNLCGLALDPNGGTWTASMPDPQNKFLVLPNLIFGGDSGGWACTIFSTANKGSIAKINGVLMGTHTGKADGSWMGLKADPAKYSPTFMGFTLIHEVKDVFTADAPNDGAILPSDPNITIDVGYLKPGTPLFLFMGRGPAGPGKWLPSIDMTAVLGPASFGWVYLVQPPIFGFALGTANTKGYGRFQVPNPKVPSAAGAVLVFQAARVNITAPGGVSLSNPVLMQFK